jgi:acetyl esterase/lipase
MIEPKMKRMKLPPMKPGMRPDFPPPPPPMMDTSPIKRKWLDVPYAHQSPTQKLDIYLPDEGEGPFPVIAAIHGGAWEMGDKGDDQSITMVNAIDRGYAVVSINYRLSHEAIFPCQIYDCKAAIRFIRANAAQYHFDPDSIAVWGGSAGGHLCALLGTSAGVKELEDLSMGSPDASSDVVAVVDWFGPAENFLKMDEELRESGLGIPDHSDARSPESHLLGRQITEVPDLVAKASPMTYINPDVPYFLIQHGDMDGTVPMQQSIHFAEALERIAGKEKVIFEILKGAEHADPAFDTPENVERVFQFLDSHMK